MKPNPFCPLCFGLGSWSEIEGIVKSCMCTKIKEPLREQVETEIDRWNDEGGNIPFSGHNDNRN